MLFGGTGFWAFSAGMRIFLGGGPMRMGTYGVLDPMTDAMRRMDHGAEVHEEEAPGHQHHH
jgi:hypothetical protein